MRFLVDKVTVGQVFLLVPLFCSVSISPPVLYIHILLCIFIFQQMHVSVIYIVLFLVPRHVSVLFAPSSGGLYPKNLVTIWYLNVYKKNFGWIQ